jgi:hypothetical protein
METLNASQFISPFGEIVGDLIDKGKTSHKLLCGYMQNQWKRRPLEILVVDKPDVNAFAESHADHDSIYIFRGALEIIYGNIFGLLSTPAFFPIIGNVNVEVTPQNLPIDGFSRVPMLRDDSNGNQSSPFFPNDQGRMTVALILAELAFEFLIFHEIGHIVGGHLEILQIRQNMRAISEFEYTLGNTSDYLLRQTLECDADAFACHVTSFVHNHDKMAEHLYKLVNPPKWKSKEFAILTYLIGVGVLFRSLYPKAPARIVQCNSFHPHPAVRACLVASSTMARELFHGYVTSDTLSDIVGDSVRNIEDVWTGLCLPGQHLEEPAVWAQNVQYATMELFKSYGNTRMLLEQYARVPRRWDNWEWPKNVTV